MNNKKIAQKVPISFDTVCAAVVFICIAGIYWIERSRGPGWGDSIGFIVAAMDGFTLSPSALEHFLYTNMNAVLVRVLPFADAISLLVSVSIFFALATLIQIYRTGYALTNNRMAALAGTIMLALSFTFWRQAEQVEVYTASTFCIASALHAMLNDIAHKRHAHMINAGFWTGLSFLIHIQTILLMPLFITYLIEGSRNQSRKAAASFFIGISGLAALILIAAILPQYTVTSVFFSDVFRSSVLHISLRSILSGSVSSIAYLAYAFHFNCIAVIAGFMLLFRNDKHLMLYTLLGIVPTWLFAMRYPVTDKYVFFLNAYLILAVIGSVGYSSLFGMLKHHLTQTAIIACALILPYFLYETVTITATHIPRLSSLHEQKAYKGGISYFLRPGLRTSPDLFTLVRKQDQTIEPLVRNDSELWQRLTTATHLYWELEKKRSQ